MVGGLYRDMAGAPDAYILSVRFHRGGDRPETTVRPDFEIRGASMSYQDSSPDSDRSAVILFDGCCNLCSGSVDFIIRNDPRHRFRFAAEQSEAGRAILQRYGLEADSLDTLVLVQDSRVYMRSDAILRIARRLKWPWPLAFGLVVVPRPLRDAVYGLVARTRYRTFGRRQACRMPRPEEAAFFITNAE